MWKRGQNNLCSRTYYYSPLASRTSFIFSFMQVCWWQIPVFKKYLMFSISSSIAEGYYFLDTEFQVTFNSLALSEDVISLSSGLDGSWREVSSHYFPLCRMCYFFLSLLLRFLSLAFSNLNTMSNKSVFVLLGKRWAFWVFFKFYLSVEIFCHPLLPSFPLNSWTFKILIF